MELIIFFIAGFFSLNMGAPSFAGSFSTACGSQAINRLKAAALFLILALLGATCLGTEVANTLSKGIVPKQFLDIKAVAVVLSAATLSLFIANMMHIPQSTSLSTLASICGVGMFHHTVNWGKLNYMVICWIIATCVSFSLIYIITRYVYPPRPTNFWVYEKVVHHKQRLKILVIMTSCYKAFAQGTNNVANVVGPLSAAGLIGVQPGLWIMGILFGLGAFIFTGPLNTSSEKIVPLGLLTATVINLVSGTITIIASKMGLPFPTVIVYTVSIFAIGSIKDGVGMTLGKPVTQKTFFTWCINPVMTLMVSYLLSKVFLTQ